MLGQGREPIVILSDDEDDSDESSHSSKLSDEDSGEDYDDESLGVRDGEEDCDEEVWVPEPPQGMRKLQYTYRQPACDKVSASRGETYLQVSHS